MTTPQREPSTHRATNLVLIGPPGSGKGTQAIRIAQRYGVPHVSTGDILRAAVKAGTPLGLEVAATLASGGLVADDLITDLVRGKLATPELAGGFVLDGFPRTLAQASALDEMVNGAPLIVALVDVPAEAIVRRLGMRRVCESCAITQSVSTVEVGHESCPYCGGQLIRRSDDEPDVVRRRLDGYALAAGPIVAHYRQRASFATIDGLRGFDDVTAALAVHIEAQRRAIE
jgi:adenylate kinase